MYEVLNVEYNPCNLVLTLDLGNFGALVLWAWHHQYPYMYGSSDLYVNLLSPTRLRLPFACDLGLGLPTTRSTRGQCRCHLI